MLNYKHIYILMTMFIHKNQIIKKTITATFISNTWLLVQSLRVKSFLLLQDCDIEICSVLPISSLLILNHNNLSERMCTNKIRTPLLHHINKFIWICKLSQRIYFCDNLPNLSYIWYSLMYCMYECLSIVCTL